MIGWLGKHFRRTMVRCFLRAKGRTTIKFGLLEIRKKSEKIETGSNVIVSTDCLLAMWLQKMMMMSVVAVAVLQMGVARLCES